MAGPGGGGRAVGMAGTVGWPGRLLGTVAGDGGQGLYIGSATVIVDVHFIVDVDLRVPFIPGQNLFVA